MENYIFWSKMGSGFEEPGGTPPPRIIQEYPPPPGGVSRTSVELCMETPLVYCFGAPIERFHSSGQHLCKGERLHKKRVQLWDTNMAAVTSCEMEFTFSVKALSFRSRTSVRAHI